MRWRSFFRAVWRYGLALAVPMAVAGAAAAAPPPLPADPVARRVLACTGCHGEQGRAAADGFHPRLAGKPAAYLHAQLRAFQDGRRRYRLMTDLLAPLSDEVLAEMAAHFAALSLPYPPPQPPTAGAAVLARGRVLALQGDAALGLPACSACHGAALTGMLPAVPGLLGLPRDYLNAQLGAWRNGDRQAAAPDCMAQIARALPLADVDALSQWLAAQRVPADARPVPAPPPGAVLVTPSLAVSPASSQGPVSLGLSTGGRASVGSASGGSPAAIALPRCGSGTP